MGKRGLGDFQCRSPCGLLAMKRRNYPPILFLRPCRPWPAVVGRHRHRTIILLSMVLSIISAQSISGIDLNNDGMSDIWQQKYSVPSADANLDYDGTGLTNSQKSLLGLDPRNPNSRFHLEIVSDSASNQLHLRLDTAFGKLYQLESSNDLRNWTSLNSAIAGTGSAVEIVQSLSGTQTFFASLVTSTPMETVSPPGRNTNLAPAIILATPTATECRMRGK
jgi:hypothetical protein